VNRILRRCVFVVSSVVFVAVVLGFVAGEFGWLGVRASGQDGAYKQMRVYAEVLKKVQTDYVTEPNVGAVTTGALHGLLDSLDSDSSYLTPTEYKIFKDRPATDSAEVGVVISRRFGYATVVTVAPGTSAEKEHLSDGDVIESIDGQSTHELSLAMMRLMLEGKPGTTVVLSVVRARKPDAEKIKLTRGVTAPPALTERQYDDKAILYLKPWVLTPTRVSEIAARLKDMAGTHKVILDLRDTAEGDAAQGVRLANFFIKQGTLATLGGQKFPQQTLTADSAKAITDAQLTVLVNRGTYGAAELTAAAIGDLKRGDVVGEKTFGEGSIQKTMLLADGSALILTVAKYSTPGGKKIQDEAVTPTVPVTVTNDADGADEGAPMGAPAATAPARAVPPARVVAPAGVAAPDNDEILDKALELLRGKAAA